MTNETEIRTSFGRRQREDTGGPSASSLRFENLRTQRGKVGDGVFYGVLGILSCVTILFLLQIFEDPEARQAREARNAAFAAAEERQAVQRAKQRAERKTAEGAEARVRKCERETTMAYVMSQDAIRAKLKSPSSAVFPWATDIVAIHAGDCKYEIVAYVDAQNGFGAMLRAYYTATLRHNPDTGTWRITSAQLQN